MGRRGDHRLHARPAREFAPRLRIDSAHQSARDCTQHASARQPRTRRRLCGERRAGRGTERNHRQPMGSQRRSGGARVPRGELFGGRDGRECSHCGRRCARRRRRWPGARGLAACGRVLFADRRNSAPRKDDQPLSWSAGSARSNSLLSPVRGGRRQISLRRVRQLHLLGQVYDRDRPSRSGRRPPLRERAVGYRGRTLATAQRHHRADHSHTTARRMASASCARPTFHAHP